MDELLTLTIVAITVVMAATALWAVRFLIELRKGTAAITPGLRIASNVSLFLVYAGSLFTWTALRFNVTVVDLAVKARDASSQQTLMNSFLYQLAVISFVPPLLFPILYGFWLYSKNKKNANKGGAA